MRFEPPQATKMLAPVLVEQALSDVPIFGPDKADIATTISAAVTPSAAASVSVELTNAMAAPLPDTFHQAKTVAGKLRALRAFVREQFPDGADKVRGGPQPQPHLGDLGAIRDGINGMSLASNGVGSCREIHDALLATLVQAPGLPREALCVVDHAMLLRAKERYLFDAGANRTIVSDDPWTRFAWDWIDGEYSLFQTLTSCTDKTRR